MVAAGASVGGATVGGTAVGVAAGAQAASKRAAAEKADKNLAVVERIEIPLLRDLKRLHYRDW
jgi:hypothetical protein